MHANHTPILKGAVWLYTNVIHKILVDATPGVERAQAKANKFFKEGAREAAKLAVEVDNAVQSSKTD